MYIIVCYLFYGCQIVIQRYNLRFGMMLIMNNNICLELLMNTQI